MMATIAIPDSYESIRRVPASETGFESVERMGTAQWTCGLKSRRRASLYKAALLAVAAFLFVLGTQLGVAQESTLYSFSFNTIGTDGAAPIGNLVFDSNGNLYGATSSGGSSADAGMIFELSPKSGGGWTEKIIYAFADAGDGSGPEGSLIFDSNGNLYGTANNVVFELSPQSGGVWTEKVLYTFNGGETDVSGPNGGLIFDQSGNLYGTSLSGGANAAYGTVYELSPPQSEGGPWTEKILHSFNNNFVDGYRPLGSLIFDANGNLYGTTSYGGANGMGTVFELTPGSGGVWTENIIFNQSYAETPYANLIFDSEGNLYSTSFSGGAPNQNIGIHGTVFELSPPQSGAAWTEQILHSFAEDAIDGGSPAAGLLSDSKGNFYSTTFHGGPYYTENNTANTDGTIFEMLPQQTGGYAEDVLYIFGTATNDGVLPTAGVISDSKGNLYGVTSEGGAYGYGAVFEYTPVPTTPMPVFSLNQGVYSSTQTVTVSDATEGATLYCTTDGTTPTTSSPVCPASFTVSATETIQAIAVYTGLANSPVANATYVIEPPAATPIINPDGGNFTTSTFVSIGDTTPGAKIYYSTTGGAPFTLYSSGFLVSSSETITAYAVATNYTQSPTTSAVFNVNLVAKLFSPAPGGTLPAGPVTFHWTAGTGATGYALWVGTTGTGSGADNVYYSGEKASTVTSLTVSGLPVNGETIYVRLITYTASGSTFTTYTYTAASGGILTTPAPGSTLGGSSATFSWTAGTGATGYALWIGSSATDSDNLYYSGEQAPTVTSLTVNGLPMNGETIYVRLITYYASSSAFTTYTYTAAVAGILKTPTPGSTLAGPSVTFSWSAGTNATGYALWIGSTGPGSDNLYYSGEKASTVTSLPVSNLPLNGETIYVRLITYYGSSSSFINYTFTAATAAVLTTPTPGGTLAGSSVTFSWSSSASATGYALWAGTTSAGSDADNLYYSGEKASTVTSLTVNGLPVNGETIYVRLITYYGTASTFTTYTYTAK
jgi:uncharacterized repeat protein (TIGR03803 family)